MVKLTDIIAPSFYKIHRDIMANGHTHYMLKGGRGSTKSSFAATEIILGIMGDSQANALIIRKVGLYLKDSVFEQLLWAIDKLGVTALWKTKLSPLELIYEPTGQRILFRGADKPKKLKSTKVHKGYIKFLWYEECDEFTGMDEIRSINQSMLRGGEGFIVFYTYNPPKSQRNWINSEVLIQRSDRLVHHSTYETVPAEWLGEKFIEEAEFLKREKPEAYRHEYLGEVTGTGGTVFENINLRTITDKEIKSFDKLYYGIDFGYAQDPFVYIVMYYDKKHKRLFLYDEIYKKGLSNERAAELIKEKGGGREAIICDSAEPKSIAEMRRYGLNCIGAKKGKDSVEYGIKFLQSLNEIIIDKNRCPETFREFYYYELEPDGNGGFRDGYPDKNNHTIDAVRYALEPVTANRTVRVIKRKEWENYDNN